MKIALLGYGKMGKVIDKIALQRGHEIVLRKSSDSSYKGLENADVAIDFSTPNSAVNNIMQCLDTNIPIICGTTGWLSKYDEVASYCKLKNGSFLYASNFSLGVNIFLQLTTYLSKIMANFQDYKVSIEEIHHTQKLDSPSGTAISIANNIIKNSNYTSWRLENTTNNQIPITAKRIENVPGTHSVYFDSEVDQIEIKHTAHSREGFALGAIIAAEWLQNKKGVFEMQDVLSLQ
jgi:4-hydroxy-tetrahydrodipicolinate reductase